MTLNSFHRLHRSSVPRSGRVWCGHSVVSARGLGLARGLWRAHTPPHTCPHMPLTRVSRCVGAWHTTPLADPQRTGGGHQGVSSLHLGTHGSRSAVGVHRHLGCQPNRCGEGGCGYGYERWANSYHFLLLWTCSSMRGTGQAMPCPSRARPSLSCPSTLSLLSATPTPCPCRFGFKPSCAARVPRGTRAPSTLTGQS